MLKRHFASAALGLLITSSSFASSYSMHCDQDLVSPGQQTKTIDLQRESANPDSTYTLNLTQAGASKTLAQGLTCDSPLPGWERDTTTLICRRERGSPVHTRTSVHFRIKPNGTYSVVLSHSEPDLHNPNAIKYSMKTIGYGMRCN